MLTQTQRMQERRRCFLWQGVEGQPTAGPEGEDLKMKLEKTHRGTPVDLHPCTHRGSFQCGSGFCMSKTSHFCTQNIKHWAPADGVLSRAAPWTQSYTDQAVRAAEASPTHLLSVNPKNALVSVGGAPDAIQRRPRSKRQMNEVQRRGGVERGGRRSWGRAATCRKASLLASQL